MHIKETGKKTAENVCLWAGVYTHKNFVFCQMQTKENKLCETEGELLHKFHQTDNEPALVFQARIDNIIDIEAMTRNLQPVRILSMDCYHRLNLKQAMQDMMTS